MEKEIQEEYERKMVALTAECSLETRKTMEAQCQKARAANEEAEELMRKINEKVSGFKSRYFASYVVLWR